MKYIHSPKSSEQITGTGRVDRPVPLLVPALSKGMTVIIDNASFHRSDKLREMIESAGCQLRYLPSYSPDFNPIEHWWHKIKNAIRMKMRQAIMNLQEAMEFTLKKMSMA